MRHLMHLALIAAMIGAAGCSAFKQPDQKAGSQRSAPELMVQLDARRATSSPMCRERWVKLGRRSIPFRSGPI
jgi:hypothetical protein